MGLEIDLSELEKKIRVFFINKHILKQAITHSSFANEAHVPDNERLEFLGDAVIKLVISEYIYNRFPEKPEGDLTKIRSAVISDDTLAKVATRIKLGEYIILSENEKKTGGDKRRSNVANVFEAIVGAIYIDGGIGKARDFLIEMLRFEIDKVSREGYIKDYKSALQEYTQKQKLALPIYKVVSETGPKHQKEFLVGVRVNGKVIGEGKGPTKKEGE